MMFKTVENTRIFPLTGLLTLLIWLLCSTVVRADVLLLPTPDSGVQPRLVQDASGGIHLLYFKKRINRPAAREGNLYYREFDYTTGRFGNPVRVSSQAFNMQTFALARSAMAVGGDGRVHVMWYLPRQSEFIYSRSNAERTSFEEQRSMVSKFVEGIDAGGDVAAFGNQVAIAWGAGDLAKEDERSIFARFSNDGGASFGEEIMIADPALGACACCSLALAYDGERLLYLAYRSAVNGTGRHMQILSIEKEATENLAIEESALDDANTESLDTNYLPLENLQNWEASFCPLSTNDIELNVGDKNFAVFETESRIVVKDLQEPQGAFRVAEPFTETRQRNPAIAINSDQEILVVWGEAISNSRGGRLNLRIFDESGEDVGYRLSEEIQIRDYSFPATASTPDGDFLVLY